MIDSIWSVKGDISIKPNNPKEGDVYYDTNTNRTYTYSNGEWVGFKILYKDYHFNRNRMMKIKNLFK